MRVKAILWVWCGLFSAVLSGPAFAQHHGPAKKYDGVVIVDINASKQEPPAYRHCEVQYNPQNPGADATEYFACQKGAEEARRMAARFGGGNGEALAKMTGYHRGILNAYNVFRNDGVEIQKGRETIEALIKGSNDFLKSAQDDGNRQAQNLAYSAAESEASSRFKNHVENGSPLNNELEIPGAPKATYKSQNPYADYSKQPYESEDAALNRVLNNLNLQASFTYDQDSIIWEAATRSRYLDLFRLNRDYNFSEYSWDNTGRAWQAWLRIPNYSRPDYDGLRAKRTPKFKTVVVTDPVTHQTHQEQVPDGFSEDAGFYKRIYQEGFKASYGYYASHYFSLAYYRYIDEAYNIGTQIGEQMGKRLALQEGMKSAFNDAYRIAFERTYAETYRNNYATAFNNKYNAYLNSPVIAIKDVNIFDSNNDAIFEAGEALSAEYSILNYGGKGSVVNLSLVGDVENSTPTQVQVDALSKYPHAKTGVLGQIPAGTPAHTQIRVGLQANGAGLKTVTTYPDNSIYVNTVAEVKSIRITNVSATLGIARVEVAVINPANQPTSDMITIAVNVSGVFPPKPLSLGILSANEIRTVTFPISGMDPLVVIRDGIEATAATFMGNRQLHSQSGSAKVHAPTDLAAYFTQLASGTAYFPSNSSLEEMFLNTKNSIRNYVDAETRSHSRDADFWTNRRGDSVVGQLAAQFNGLEASTKSRLAEAFEVLGASIVMSFNNIDDDRQPFIRLVQEFAPKAVDEKGGKKQKGGRKF